MVFCMSRFIIAGLLIGLPILCSIIMDIGMVFEGSSCSIKDGESENMTFLQQHVSYFDINKDAIVYPWETFVGVGSFLHYVVKLKDMSTNFMLYFHGGMHALGYNILFSVAVTIFANGALSYPSLPTWIPSPLFPIYIANVHRDKHGSDTGNYDYDGRFVQSNFESLVKEYANTKTDELTLDELWKMTEDHRVAYDFNGWLTAKIEFGLLYFLAKDEDGFLSKEAFYQVYDGTLFYNIAKEHQAKKLRQWKII